MSSESNSSNTVQLKSRALYKFYEPLVLFEALNLAGKDNALPAESAEFVEAHDLKRLYHAFVYKLAHLCDNVKGLHGGSITAVTILRSSSGDAQYYFASNNRTPEQLEETCSYIDRLLTQVKDIPEEPFNHSPIPDEALRSVLLFNRSRIALYLKQLQSQAEECLEYYSYLESDNRTLVERCIIELLDKADLETLSISTEPQYLTGCETLLDQLQSFTQSRAGLLVQTLAREGRMWGHKSKECWSEFQHTISRFQAYPQSVKFLRKARKQWADLFENYEILAIPSSSPIARPFRNKSQTADSIVGRMTSDHEEIDTFRNFVTTLQNFDLDDRIRHQWRNVNFRPIVHAEVILLNWLENNGGISPQRFFNQWMYIGSSKPTCRLCQYFFETHGSNVEYRPSHGNIYISWRFPDVLVSQGAKAQNTRQVIMDKMLVKIREDAFQLVMRKIPSSFKEHDSNTFSIASTLRNSYRIETRRSVGMDDLTSLIGHASFAEV